MGISTFMGLETNKRGLSAQQTALYTVGNNISNANTIGYTRQRVNLAATSGYPGIGQNTPMFAGHLGTGVTSESITRIRDTFIDKQYRQETNNLGYWTQQTNSISQMEDIMSEPSEYGLSAAFEDFFSSWQELANSPSSSAARQVVYTKSAHLASSFNYMSTQMTQVQTNLKYEAMNTVNNVNSILSQIASLNNQIKTVEPNGYIPNELYDRRDLLLDELAEYMPISTENVQSGGLAGPDAEGSMNVYYVDANGTKNLLVSTSQTQKSFAATVSLQTFDETGVEKDLSVSDTFEAIGSLKIELKETSSEKMTMTPATLAAGTVNTVNFAGGASTVALGITTDANGTITDVTYNGNSVLADFKNGSITIPGATANDPVMTLKLNVSADQKTIKDASLETTTTTSSSKTDVKDMQANKGSIVSYIDSYGKAEVAKDLQGNVTLDANGKATITTHGYFHDKLEDLNKLAREFAKQFNDLHKLGYGLSADGTTASPQGKAFFEDGVEVTAATIKVSDLMKDFNNIAASTANLEEGNGKQALALSNLSNKPNTGLNEASAQKFYESMVADVGTEGEKAVKMEYNSGTIRLTISNNRDSVTTVSLDEEMTDMIRFQQAYNASARMVTVVDETLDKIINGMGRVGL
ncbi:flagellar hook-associated protein FlgK [Kurthia senegalensis]|uniref:flagellar hook-associated protein FlgK n=1 Tax=Kurthia senegalensis TaxID=1033740 RepID=UPI0002896513|nr:flagellar hook-associated protein FlgK [Kurthia senegalensis]